MTEQGWLQVEATTLTETRTALIISHLWFEIQLITRSSTIMFHCTQLNMIQIKAGLGTTRAVTIIHVKHIAHECFLRQCVEGPLLFVTVRRMKCVPGLWDRTTTSTSYAPDPSFLQQFNLIFCYSSNILRNMAVIHKFITIFDYIGDLNTCFLIHLKI